MRGEWRARLAHIFVDEYQDINAAQDAILTALSRDGAAANRFLVGDVKQSIYRFRLANPEDFSTVIKNQWSRAAHGAPGGQQRVSLTENFRSREALAEFCESAVRRVDAGGNRRREITSRWNLARRRRRADRRRESRRAGSAWSCI